MLHKGRMCTKNLTCSKFSFACSSMINCLLLQSSATANNFHKTTCKIWSWQFGCKLVVWVVPFGWLADLDHLKHWLKPQLHVNSMNSFFHCLRLTNDTAIKNCLSFWHTPLPQMAGYRYNLYAFCFCYGSWLICTTALVMFHRVLSSGL